MIRVSIFIILFLNCFITSLQAQYAPQVPLPGNEAVSETSPLFKDWASGCTVYRGWLDIADKNLGSVSLGTVSDVYGAPGSGLLSLGDSGVAVITFNYSMFNGAGPDFAVFENAFANPENDTLAYLEFAFVEVSSNGTDFFRFPASCNMQDTAQIDNFTYTDARFYHNLAGKYISKYGTPFDLEELKGQPGLDVNNITHVRIVDVVGSINPAHASYDKDNHIINDPYPSAFISGGFDLNGIGVINSNKPPTAISEAGNTAGVKIFPNPASDKIHIVTQNGETLQYRLTDINGRIILQGTMLKNEILDIHKQAKGLYLLYLGNEQKFSAFKITKQ